MHICYQKEDLTAEQENKLVDEFKRVKKVSEYDQESQTADKPMAPRGRATQNSRDTRTTNYAKQTALSFPSR